MLHHKEIFPHEVVKYSLEKHINQYNPKSVLLYQILLILLLLALVMLIVIKVDVSVRSSGFVRPVQDRSDIRSPVEGVIDSLFISENAHVKSGQPLMKVRSQEVDKQNLALTSRYKDLETQIRDLKSLLSGNSNGLLSSIYRQQYTVYIQKLHNATNRCELARKNYKRYAPLYKQKVVSAAEFDQILFEKRAAESELSLVKEQQKSLWQGELNNLTLQIQQLQAELGINEEQKLMYTIKAPLTGTIQDLKGIQPGSFVSPNEVLCEISPDTGLIAEVYVLPKDIGLIKIGNPVHMQIDAFDYNIWGKLTGVVQSISDDIHTHKDQHYFKVRCHLNQQVLRLKNGYQGRIKKGMTLQARFLITRRSLFQLLYDKADDWLDPKASKNSKAV